MSIESEIFKIKRDDPSIERRYVEGEEFSKWLESRGGWPKTWDEQPLIDAIEKYLETEIQPHNRGDIKAMLHRHYSIGGY